MKTYAQAWGRGEEQVFRVEEILYQGTTPWQKVDLIRAEGYGRILFLDGQWQSSEADEFIYHEMLVHPAMFHHPNPARVFIAGGGEGATAREVLRHTSVKTVTQLDIDAEVVALCRQMLPEWSAGAYEDPRTKLIIGDALLFLQETHDRYDVMLLDLPDIAPETPSEALYAPDFYQLVRSKLAPGGIVALHVGPCHPVHLDWFLDIAYRLQVAFPWTLFYPVAERRWIFGLCSNGAPTAELFDTSRLLSPLRYYNAALHTTLGTLPTYITHALTETRGAR